jgi:hypothetical protein
MDRNTFELSLAVIGTVCWAVCFWWMGRISAKQNAMMDRLSEQTQRIERFSKVEHDLIKEVHPQVGEIKEGLAEMIAAVKENSEDVIAAVKENTESQGSPGPAAAPSPSKKKFRWRR